MPTQIALLRGINVSGKNPVRMEDLRASFACLGFADIRTYVQSGNVIFNGARTSGAALARQIEARIQKDFGIAVPVLVRSAPELAKAIGTNPFLKEKAIDPSKLHVTFLAGSFDRAGLKKLEGLATGRDRFIHVRQELYLHCPDGYGRTKLSNAAIEKALAIAATTRNWKTVNQLGEIAAEM